jgi:hypothetical protein
LEDRLTREVVIERLRAAIHDRRVSTLKLLEAVKAAGLTGALAGQLDEVVGERIEKYAITRPTALFIDKSGSMEVAIEVARYIAAIISGCMRADLFLYAFDSDAFAVAPPPTEKRTSVSAWREAIRFSANGSTSIGAAMAALHRDGHRADLIILVSDGAENTAPFFVHEYHRYEKHFDLSPEVIFVSVGDENTNFTRVLNNEGIRCARYRFLGDYYSLVNLLPLLTSRADLVSVIMSTPIPTSR